jgi:septin 7
MEEERVAHEQKLIKMESEMRAVFQAKVTEKEAKLKHSESEVKIGILYGIYFILML